MRYALVALSLLCTTPAKADVFCNALGCADFPGISRVAIYTQQAIAAGLYFGALGYLGYQLADTYYVHEVLHRKRTFCDQAMRLFCDPAKSPPLLFYTEPNPRTHN